MGRRTDIAAIAFILVSSIGGRASAQFLVQGLDGPVTSAEVQAFKSHMKMRLSETGGTGPFNILAGNRGNNYVYGQTGGALEGLIAMYQVSPDRELMDMMIWMADQMLLHRNDRFQKWTTFTGKVEPCWPNARDDEVWKRPVCGTEQGDVLGHITAVAKLIARSPSLWQLTVPGEDRLQLGGTYLERARGFIREARVTMDGFLTPNFVHPTSKRFVHPDTDAYGMLMGVGHLRGKTVPWNQNTMLAGGYLDVGETLEVLKEEPQTVAQYDAIVKAFSDAFFKEVTRYMVMGYPVYNWSYASGDPGPTYRYPEDLGHGGYDFWGLYKAFVRGKAGITREQMVPFANTIRYVVMRPNGSFSEKVSGAGGDRSSMGSTWLYVIFFRPDLYKTIGGSLMGEAASDPDTAGRLLWAKSMNARGWTAEPPVSSDGGVPMPPLSDGGPADAGASRDAGPEDSGSGSGGGGSGGSSGNSGRAGAGGAAGGTGGSLPPPDDAPEEPPSRKPRNDTGCRMASTTSDLGAPVLGIIVLAVVLARRRRAR